MQKDLKWNSTWKSVRYALVEISICKLPDAKVGGKTTCKVDPASSPATATLREDSKRSRWHCWPARETLSAYSEQRQPRYTTIQIRTVTFVANSRTVLQVLLGRMWSLPYMTGRDAPCITSTWTSATQPQMEILTRNLLPHRIELSREPASKCSSFYELVELHSKDTED